MIEKVSSAIPGLFSLEDEQAKAKRQALATIRDVDAFFRHVANEQVAGRQLQFPSIEILRHLVQTEELLTIDQIQGQAKI